MLANGTLALDVALHLRDGWNRDRILQEINAAGVPCYSGSCSEVYLEKVFDGTDWWASEFALQDIEQWFRVHRPEVEIVPRPVT